jgi:hypothetical protein
MNIWKFRILCILRWKCELQISFTGAPKLKLLAQAFMKLIPSLVKAYFFIKVDQWKRIFKIYPRKQCLQL